MTQRQGGGGEETRSGTPLLKDPLTQIVRDFEGVKWESYLQPERRNETTLRLVALLKKSLELWTSSHG